MYLYILGYDNNVWRCIEGFGCKKIKSHDHPRHTNIKQHRSPAVR